MLYLIFIKHKNISTTNHASNHSYILALQLTLLSLILHILLFLLLFRFNCIFFYVILILYMGYTIVVNKEIYMFLSKIIENIIE